MPNPFYADYSSAVAEPFKNFFGLEKEQAQTDLIRAQTEDFAANAGLRGMERAAHAAYYGAQTKKIMEDLNANEEMRKILSAYDPTPGAPQSKQLGDMALLLQKGGFAQQARDFLQRSAQAELSEARQAGLQQQGEMRRQFAIKKRLESFDRAFGWVKTEDDLEQAKAAYIFNQQVVDPEGLDDLQNLTLETVLATQKGLLSAKQKADLAVRQQAEARRAGTAASAADRAQQRIDIAREAEARKQSATQDKAKQEGKTSKGPSAQDVRNAGAFVAELPEAKGLSPAGMNALRTDLAARTLAYMQQRPQLKYPEAQALAWADLKKSGALEEVEFLPGFSRKAYTPMGSGAKPLPPIGSSKEAPLPDDLTGFKPDETVIYTRGKNRYKYNKARGGLEKVQ